MTLVLPVLTVLMPVGPVGAVPSGPPDFSLTVSPSRLVVPADQITRPRQFTVSNQGRRPVDVLVGAASFTTDKDGNPVFDEGAPHSAVGWVAAQPRRLHLAARAAEQVSLRIAVPGSAEPGDYQVAVIFSVPTTNRTGISVSRSVGVPVYLTVPGIAVDSVRVASLSVPKFTFGGPVNLRASVRNDGTVHRDFVADDRLVAKASGQTVAFPDFTLPRGSTQEVSAKWADPPWLCVCRVAVSVTNPDGTSQHLSTTIVVLSSRLVGVLVALVLLLFAALILRRSRRRRSARIASEARARTMSGVGLSAPMANAAEVDVIP